MHATEDQIIDHVLDLGGLDDAVSAHVAGCAACQEEAEKVREVLKVAEYVPEMPEDLSKTVWERLKPRLTPRPRWPRYAQALAAAVAIAVISVLITLRVTHPPAKHPAAIPPQIAQAPRQPVAAPPAPQQAPPAPPQVAKKNPAPAPARLAEPEPPIRFGTTDGLHLPAQDEMVPPVAVFPRSQSGVAMTQLAPPEEPQFDRETWLRYGAHRNFFIDQVERLPGNVGYLRITAFFYYDMSGGRLATAMDFLSGTDALIIDLRDTRSSGDAAMTELFTDYFRNESDVNRSEKYLNRDLFILTSYRDSCAPVAVARDLQILRNATVVGQQTHGFPKTTLVTPNGRYDVPCPTSAAAPTSGHSEFGVTPNIHATEEEARDVAYLEALKRLNAANPKSDLAHERHRAIAILQKKLKSVK